MIPQKKFGAMGQSRPFCLLRVISEIKMHFWEGKSGAIKKIVKINCPWISILHKNVTFHASPRIMWISIHWHLALNGYSHDPRWGMECYIFQGSIKVLYSSSVAWSFRTDLELLFYKDKVSTRKAIKVIKQICSASRL